MIKLLLLLFLFLLSLLVIFRAPTKLLWYASILVTEFSWLFILLVLCLLFWLWAQGKVPVVGAIAGISAIIIFLIPYWQAWRLGQRLKNNIDAAFGVTIDNEVDAPFTPLKIFTGIGAQKITYQPLLYDFIHQLSLHFYPSKKSGNSPCVVVIHGGSWSAGDNLQLPELNSELAKAGYHVASISYRLAPTNLFPAPVEDVQKAISFLKEKATDLAIDSTRLVLLGRSAGGQIALTAAYTLRDPSIKGVIDFYGPADMVWGWHHPTNPLVLDSRKVMKDYLGGIFEKKPKPFIASSATETAASASPPTLMIYAENDPLVSPRHGNRLSKKLVAAGVPHFALYLPWATHGFDYTLNGPGGQLSTWTVKRFLEIVLEEKK